MSQISVWLCTDRVYQVHTKKSISARSEHQRENNGKSVRMARYTQNAPEPSITWGFVRKQNHFGHFRVIEMAESEGFEPSIQVYPV